MVRTTSLLCLVLGLGGGCARKEEFKPVFPVSGKLTHQGEAMAGALIGFHPLDDSDPRAPHPVATADKEGKFVLASYFAGDGAPAGEYVVTIYWPAKRPKGKAADPNEDEDIQPDRLKRAYADLKATKLRATVAQHTNTIDFALP